MMTERWSTENYNGLLLEAGAGPKRHQAENSDQDEDRLHRARGNVARAMLSLTRLTMGNHHGCGYAGDREKDLKHGPNGYASVLVAADNVVAVVQDRVVEPEGLVSRTRMWQGTRHP
jgi:hypothetical protein